MSALKGLFDRGYRLVGDSVRLAWRLVVAVVGGTVLLLGLALIVLPGPAIVVVPIGLAILGLEFAWARRLLKHVRRTAHDVRLRVARRRGDERLPLAPGPRSCPLCGASLAVESDLHVGEAVDCPSCGAALEVENADPLRLVRYAAAD
jgi:lysine biosynthesis protein LysW